MRMVDLAVGLAILNRHNDGKGEFATARDKIFLSGPSVDDLPEQEAIELAQLGFNYSWMYECWEVLT